MDKPIESAPLLHPVVQECIDNYGKYYAEQHKLGMSVRSDMIYVAQLAIRWADNAAAGSGGQDDPTHLRMQIGYLAGELQIAGDKRSTPEIVETAAQATKEQG